jgi:hypothetical protein
MSTLSPLSRSLHRYTRVHWASWRENAPPSKHVSHTYVIIAQRLPSLSTLFSSTWSDHWYWVFHRLAMLSFFNCSSKTQTQTVLVLNGLILFFFTEFTDQIVKQFRYLRLLRLLTAFLCAQSDHSWPPLCVQPSLCPYITLTGLNVVICFRNTVTVPVTVDRFPVCPSLILLVTLDQFCVPRFPISQYYINWLERLLAKQSRYRYFRLLTAFLCIQPHPVDHSWPRHCVSPTPPLISFHYITSLVCIFAKQLHVDCLSVCPSLSRLLISLHLCVLSLHQLVCVSFSQQCYK